MKIAYIGIDTLDAVLKELLSFENCEIIRIFTCPTDNKTEFNTEVISLAEAHNIPWTDARIREEDMEALKDAGCEGVICTGDYYKIPISGILPVVNVHPALLPVGRGAWPMPVTILKRLPFSGVTIIRMNNALDEGEILLQDRFAVAEDETLKTLTEKLSRSAEKLIRTLMTDFHGYYARALPQGDGEYWSNPTEKDWTVTPDMPDDEIDRVLRAFAGYECVWSEPDARYELIDAQLYADEADVPADWRRFRTCGGSFVAAPRVSPATEEIELSHEAEIRRLLAMTGNDSSAYAFPSLYIWQKALGLRVAFFRECFIVKYTQCGENAWFFPVGKAEDCRAFLAKHMDEPDFSLHYVPEDQVTLLRQWFPGRLCVAETPDDSEYICDVEGHMLLTGKAYANVRKQFRKASRDNHITLTPLSIEDLSYAQTLLKAWQAEGKGNVLSDDAELLAVRYAEALQMELHFIRLNGEICGIIGGFPLSEDTFDGCVFKLTVKLPGLSYAAKRLFFETLRGRYAYVNIEEDLGIVGLRMMKQRLVPVRMNNMWEVHFHCEA